MKYNSVVALMLLILCVYAPEAKTQDTIDINGIVVIDSTVFATKNYVDQQSVLNDKQQVDEFSLDAVTKIISLSIQRDGVANEQLDLSPLFANVTNIYSADGSLSSDRVVAMGGNDLSFNGGNVGIGTTNPLFKLDVDGVAKLQTTSSIDGANQGIHLWNSFGRIYYDAQTTGNANRGLVIQNTQTNALGILFRNADNERTFHVYGSGEARFHKYGLGNYLDNSPAYLNVWNNAGQVREGLVSDYKNHWSENGGELFYNLSNVGIGTDDPAAKLHIKGVGFIANQVEGTSAADSYWKYTGGNQMIFRTINGSSNFFTLNSSNAVLNSSILNLQHTGNVGIGTDSPNRLLDIENAVPSLRFTDTDVTGLYYEMLSLADGTFDLRLDESNVGADTDFRVRLDGQNRFEVYDQGLKIPSSETAVVANQVLNGIDFYTDDPSFLSRTVNRIASIRPISNSSVGQAHGMGFYTSNTDTDADLKMTLTSVGDLQIARSFSTGSIIEIVGIGDRGIVGTDNDFPLTLRADNNEFLRGLSNGNVGIGTDTPSEKLEVDGNILASGNITGTHYGDGSNLTGITGDGFEANTDSQNLELNGGNSIIKNIEISGGTGSFPVFVNPSSFRAVVLSNSGLIGNNTSNITSNDADIFANKPDPVSFVALDGDLFSIQKNPITRTCTAVTAQNIDGGSGTFTIETAPTGTQTWTTRYTSASTALNGSVDAALTSFTYTDGDLMKVEAAGATFTVTVECTR